MVGVGRDLCGSPSPTPCRSRVTYSKLHRALSRRRSRSFFKTVLWMACFLFCSYKPERAHPLDSELSFHRGCSSGTVCVPSKRAEWRARQSAGLGNSSRTGRETQLSLGRPQERSHASVKRPSLFQFVWVWLLNSVTLFTVSCRRGLRLLVGCSVWFCLRAVELTSAWQIFFFFPVLAFSRLNNLGKPLIKDENSKGFSYASMLSHVTSLVEVPRIFLLQVIWGFAGYPDKLRVPYAGPLSSLQTVLKLCCSWVFSVLSHLVGAC